MPDEVGTRTTRLTLDLAETVTTNDGKLTHVTVTVADAKAEGDDADGERDAAVGRVIAISPRETAWEITFSGGALGTEGQIRAADLALLAHLMAPTEPKVRPAVGGSIPEAADIRTGWATKRLTISGQSTLAAERREGGRAVSLYQGTLQGEAPVSLRLGLGPAPSAADVANSVGDGVIACFFLLALPCLFPGVFSSFITDATVNMTGPIQIQQNAVLHRESGRLLRVSGSGTAQIGGNLPTINLSRSRTAPAEARELSGKDVGLTLAWTFEERLSDAWPKDALPRTPIVIALVALGVAVLSQLGTWLWLRRSDRRSGRLQLAA
jgi:hypothetical protein